MKTICSWCGKYLHGDQSSLVISHGICKECSEARRNELK